jgi:hypothetical protein
VVLDLPPVETELDSETAADPPKFSLFAAPKPQSAKTSPAELDSDALDGVDDLIADVGQVDPTKVEVGTPIPDELADGAEEALAVGSFMPRSFPSGPQGFNQPQFQQAPPSNSQFGPGYDPQLASRQNLDSLTSAWGQPQTGYSQPLQMTQQPEYPSYGGHNPSSFARPSFDLAACECDSKVGMAKQREAEERQKLDNSKLAVQRLERQLKGMNPQKYGVLSFEYYQEQNAKLGPDGKVRGVEPEKSFEELLAESNFDDRNMKFVPELNDFHPCFYFCSGKYQHNAFRTDQLKAQLWHHDRYHRYLQFLLQKETASFNSFQQSPQYYASYQNGQPQYSQDYAPSQRRDS